MNELAKIRKQYDKPFMGSGCLFTHDEVGALLAKIARLQAIVDNLPKYADTSRPIVIGSIIYAKRKWSPGVVVYPWRVRNLSLTGITAVRGDLVDQRRGEVAYFHPSKCYSTPEAAEAAREEGK